MNKRDVQQVLDMMPDDIDIDELMYRLSLLKKIREAEDDLRAGRVMPHDDFVRETEAWFK
ncbi:MAG: hypothetical protein HYX51_02045 [Chloroflexi bacterium]|nr:hypothetical protein [Chloroflexota bacterium]